MSRSPDAYPTSAFDYELPADRIALYPAPERDQSRLLLLHRASGALEHLRFRDLARLIPAGDALVLNITRVLPARLLGRRTSGGPAEVLLLRPLPGGLWEALVRPGTKLRPGKRVEIADDLAVDIVDLAEAGARVVRLDTTLPVRAALERYGQMPLPPYIDRAATASDAERYQTVYASTEGSVAAPTAGLHFTDELLTQLQHHGVQLVRILLHVGVGTFRPVEVDDPAQHVMHPEWYEVSEAAANALNTVRAAGRQIWAVGTTVARTLETVCDDQRTFHPGEGETRIFIRPPYNFRGLDRLITNFHLPRSTLLMLVAAFGGYQKVMHAYRVAIEQGYRFYSFGDAMAIV
ncbi:MAG TPA: tRNA preQ1(34) S-adenosylmethionine ribosyltransferase-isomerase QueA [Longimicrobiales bacterium]|nr:tRNA preQ1(34) S-adenosylmethionine ribosyltransferase-isomerase QueA [Longimicrobiales bacterium]